MGKFGEPWRRVCERDDRGHEDFGIVDSKHRGITGMHYGMDESETDRVIACVNALSGIPDPAALVEAVKALAAATTEAGHALDDGWNPGCCASCGDLWPCAPSVALSALRVVMGEK